MKDYVPKGDTKLIGWMRSFVLLAENLSAECSVRGEDFDKLRALTDEFAESHKYLYQKQGEYRGAQCLKRSSRRKLTDHLRCIVRQMDVHPRMDNSKRKLLGLNQKGLALPKAEVAALTPGIRLESKHGMVEVHFGPSPVVGRRNGKPRGVRRVNIFRRKAGEGEFELCAYATKSPYVDHVDGRAADWEYCVQYVGTKENSQLSEVRIVAARGALAA